MRSFFLRKYSIDWLRIFGILLLFPFHAARVFDRWEPNYIKDIPNDFSTWFVAGTSFWFMPLLFLIAGFSSYHALLKRTGRQYQRERFFRLLIPFLIGMVLIVPIQGYLAKVQQYAYQDDYFTFLGSYFLDFSDLSGYTGTFTPAHLWFLGYLYIISLSLLPVMKKIMKTSLEDLNGYNKPLYFLLAAFPLTLAEALPGLSGKNIFYYAAYFLLGFFVGRMDGFMENIRRFRMKGLIILFVTVPAYFILQIHFNWPSGVSVSSAVTALCQNLAALVVILVLLGFADTYINRPSSLLSYLNTASFPVYVLHQSVMMVIAYFVVQWDSPFIVKYPVIMIGTLAASFLAYEVLKRFKATAFFLGIKKL